MINIVDKSMCSGCHACMAVCSKSAIKMKRDNEGFLYPFVDKEKCIDCGLCDKSCQAINPIITKNDPKAYACNSLNDEIRMQSSSGGVFSIIAEWIIQQNGVVFGAGFDESLKLVHMSVDNMDDLSKLRGSKYVQSEMGNSYIEAKENLEQGRLVLFTGTPCQIDGLLHYLKKSYENLFTQDIICHGVPSPYVWEKYLKYQENANNSKVANAPSPSFRSKKEGWLSFSQTLNFENGTNYSQIHKNDIYMKAFLRNVSLRHSCYNCHSKTINRNSDITLADLWGCKEIAPDLFDDKGTSFILVNSEKGKNLFEIIKNKTKNTKIDLDAALEKNPAAFISVKKPPKRDYFFKNIDSFDLQELVEKSIEPTFAQKVKGKIAIWMGRQ